MYRCLLKMKFETDGRTKQFELAIILNLISEIAWICS